MSFFLSLCAIFAAFSLVQSQTCSDTGTFTDTDSDTGDMFTFTYARQGDDYVNISASVNTTTTWVAVGFSQDVLMVSKIPIHTPL